MSYYNKEIKEVLKLLDTSEDGLKSSDVEKRKIKFGKNLLYEKKKTSAITIFLSQFAQLLIILLLFAGTISMVLGELSDSIVIFSIVLLNAFIGFFQEYKAEKAMDALKKILPKITKVIRNEDTVEIDVTEIVPGDIIVLEEGQHIPADARLIKVINLKVDESILTGESVNVAKNESTLNHENLKINDTINMVFMGTTVISGRGIAVVTETGMNTEYGKIAELTTETDSKKSPLQDEMESMGKFIAKSMSVICLVVFAYGIFIHHFDVAKMIVFAISLAVAIIPEGLPATITISLAMGVKALAKKNAIVRKLSSVETLGCTTVICSDKTGTITKNKMSVERIFLNGKFFDTPKKVTSENEIIFRISSLCNNACYCERKYIGDPTETALLEMAINAELNKHELDRKCKRISEIPFDSERKMMTSLNLSSGKEIAHVKGSPLDVLDKCKYFYFNEKIKPMTKKDLEYFKSINSKMSDDALRVLALAFKDCSKVKKSLDIEKDLTFVGFVGMMDLPREEVAESIKLCKEAGIKVIMITGDQRNTAKAVAMKVGIISSEEEIMTGDELWKLSDKHLSEKLATVRVFARASPGDKTRIISALRRNNEVIAMTGDGVNDAPALKNADIGVAMGITGTDVSKEASKIVLTDDSFSTIVTAVKQGRTVYNNIKKFILYAQSGITAQLFCVLIALFSGWPLPLLAVQILWVDLGTEVLPALSLGLDKPDKDILKKKPREKGKKLMDKEMISNILRFSIWEAAITTIIFFYFMSQGELIKAQTITFSLIVFFQMFNIFNVRNLELTAFRKETFSNMYTVGAVIISVVMQIIVVQTAFFNNLFHTTPLTLNEWIILIGIASSILWLEEIRKVWNKAIKFIQHKRGMAEVA